MTPDLRTLTEQAIALPGWKWLPGMLDDVHKMRVTKVHAEIGAVELLNSDTSGGRVTLFRSREDIRRLEMRPDITDPATGGVLLWMMEQAESGFELARTPGEAHKDDPWCALASPDAAEWVTGYGATFGEAIARLAVKRGGWA